MDKKNPIQNIIFNNLTEIRTYEVLKLRTEGYKLKEIGGIFNITRERVRQIESEAIEEITNNIKENESDLIKLVVPFTNKKDIEGLNDIQNKIVKYVVSKAEEPLQIKYSYYFDLLYVNENDLDLLIDKLFIAREYDEDMASENFDLLFNDFFGKEINCYDLELTMEKMGYKKYNGTFFKGAMTISRALIHYFTKTHEVIKTSDKRQMENLSEKLNDIYGLYTDSGRALLVRIQDNLMLIDKGTYASVDTLRMKEELRKEVVNYINNFDVERISYKKLFNEFHDELLLNSNINNPHGLHGALKVLESEGYGVTTSRYYAHKEDAKTTESKHYFLDVANYLEKQPGDVLISDLLEKFPHYNETSILYTQNYFPQVISWNKDSLINVKAITVTDAEKRDLVELVEKLMDNDLNYTNAHIVFSALMKKFPDRMREENIDNSRKLFYVLREVCDTDKIFFSLPHIVKGDYTSFNMLKLSKLAYPERELVDRKKLEESILRYYKVNNSSVDFVIKTRLNDYEYMGRNIYVKQKK